MSENKGKSLSLLLLREVKVFFSELFAWLLPSSQTTYKHRSGGEKKIRKFYQF
jgi:hypothetical protein